MGVNGGKKLNREQAQAVEYDGGPLIILAGAGTGKTTVITERIKHLIASGVAPSEILALTFTEKAAREMEERVDVALPLGYADLSISTFHSFCDRVLRDEALAMGWDPTFKLMTTASSIQFVRDNLFEFDLKYYRPLGNPIKFVGAMLTHFSRLADEDVSPREYLSWAKKIALSQASRNDKSGQGMEAERWLELAGAYKKYEELKIKNSVFDFSDLITKTLELFEKRPNVLRQYRNKYKHVLVDEYQDVNYAQSRLAIMLAGEKANAQITVCGDDDQSIYRFRGAAVSNIVGFRKAYPKAKLVVLTKNYRSTQEILDRAYALITNNNPDRLEVVEKVDKKLISAGKKKGTKIRMLRAKNADDEAYEVAKEIVRLTGDPSSRKATKGLARYEYQDIAILVRANNHGEVFGRALARAGVPWQFLGPGKLFEQEEILDLIAYLKLLVDMDDSVSMYRLLGMDGLGINERDLAKALNFAKRNSISLYEALGELGTKEMLKVVAILEAHAGMVRKEPAGQLLYWFLEEAGILQKLVEPGNEELAGRAKNIAKFFEKLRGYENEAQALSSQGSLRPGTVRTVVDWIELASELGESPLTANEDWSENNAVNILTVHSSKGLEFPVVLMVNLVMQRFPSMNRAEMIPIPEELIKETLPAGDFHMQEERRLFYVGMTRAKEKLYFSAADFYGEGKRAKRISPFVGEAGLLSSQSSLQPGEPEFSYKEQSEARLSSRQGRLQPDNLKIDYLSYSQIEAFRTCPMHYKLRYMLGLPSRPSAALSFGVSVHEAMAQVLSSRGSLHPGKPGKQLIKKLLDKNWVREGYRNKAHQEKARAQAAQYVLEYFSDVYDSKIKTVGVEQKFSVKLGKGLKVGGKMDRVDRTRKGIEIIDYKTGAKVPTQKQVDENLQLTIYALAATQIMDKPFGYKPEEVKLSLYYFDGQQKLTTTRTKKQLEEAVKEICEIRDEIEKSDFVCSGSYFCKNCEWKMFCGRRK